MKNELIPFKSGDIKKLQEELLNFCSDASKAMFSNLSINHQMGIILHGKAGTGKTSAAMLLGRDLVDNNQAIFS